MNAFIVTIAMLIIIRAAALNVTKAHIVIGLPEGYVSIAKIGIGSFPFMIFIFLFLYVLFHIMLKYTRFGRSVYAIGDNIDAAYASGINTDKIVIITFVIAGMLSAITGWVLAARFRSVAPGLGEGMIFDTVAAAVIGGVSLRGGIGKMSGMFGGVLLLTIIGNILNLLEFSPFHINMIRGGVVFLAVLIDSLKYRREV
jgi:ribose/xylose/arabinose/galactoside ABC-type transport system permease subunit